MSGLIKAWKSNNGVNCFEYDVGSDINWTCCHPVVDHIILCGSESGEGWMFNIKDPNQMKVFPSFGEGNSYGRVMSDGKKVVMGYEDGSIRIWDMKTAKAVHSITDGNDIYYLF